METNIVFVDVEPFGLRRPRSPLASRASVRVGAFGPTAPRLVTHLDFPPGAVDETLEAFRRVVDACRSGVGARTLAL